MATDDVNPDSLAAAIKSTAHVEQDVEVVVRLSNRASRALHYISDVRATRYDAGTRTLTLALSDEGRQVIPGAISKLPVFRHIDPGSDAEVRLRVPDKIIKLSRSAPPGQLAFESHSLDEVEHVVVEIGWSDVPFYKDTRARAQADARLPAARWQQNRARATKRLKPGRKGKDSPPTSE